MKCPECDFPSMIVVDTRCEYDGQFTRRRLECKGCFKRVTSYEVRSELLIDNSAKTFNKTINRIKEESRLKDPVLRNFPPRYEPAGVISSKFSVKTFFRDICLC